MITMVNLLEYKAQVEHELLMAQAKLKVIDDLISVASCDEKADVVADNYEEQENNSVDETY